MYYIAVLNQDTAECEIYPFKSYEDAMEFSDNDDRVLNNEWMITEKVVFL